MKSKIMLVVMLCMFKSMTGQEEHPAYEGFPDTTDYISYVIPHEVVASLESTLDTLKFTYLIGSIDCNLNTREVDLVIWFYDKLPDDLKRISYLTNRRVDIGKYSIPIYSRVDELISYQRLGAANTVMRFGFRGVHLSYKIQSMSSPDWLVEDSFYIEIGDGSHL
ncbi:MAG: hypothetical protein EP346_09305 [Bacteroidetes bacterium]|nr:MAG: hypothetical protein EP346_09305 [Bacteroidota bacterium]